MNRVLEEIPSGACLVDRDGTISAANDALATLVDSESGALIDEPLSSVFGEDADEILEFLRPGDADGTDTVSRMCEIHADGVRSLREVECSVTADGRVLCVLRSPPDEQAGGDDGDRGFEALLDSFPLPILTVRQDGSVESWNRMAEQVLGWTESDVIGGRPPFLSPGTDQQWGAIRQRVGEGEVVVDEVLRIRTVDNTLRHVTVSAAPVREVGGEVRPDLGGGPGADERPGTDETSPADEGVPDAASAGDLQADPGTGTGAGDAAGPEPERTDVDGMLVVIRDVTEPKEQAQQLRLLDRVLRHNIRNDMNVVLGHAELLAGEIGDPDLESSVEAILDRAEDIIDLSNKARDFKDVIDAEYEIEDVDVAALVEKLVAEYRETHPDLGLAVNVPPEARANAIRPIGTAIDNLVENAIEHNDAPDPEIEVTVSRTRAHGRDCVEVTVEDNGPGIPESERKVFIEGQENPLRHGSGLGLWLVYWIVRKSNGELLFSEREPRGSVLTIRLERAREFTL